MARKAATPPAGAEGGAPKRGGGGRRRVAEGAGTAVSSSPAGNPMNNPEVKGAIVRAFDEIGKLTEKRKEINADIKALREGLVARLGNKHAVDDAYRHHLRTEDQRAGYDRAMGVLRDAIGDPLQPALFDAGGEPTAQAGGASDPEAGDEGEGDGDGISEDERIGREQAAAFERAGVAH